MLRKQCVIVLVVSLMTAACSDDSRNRRGPDDWDLNDDVSVEDDAGDVGDEVDGDVLDADAPDADTPDADTPDADTPDADTPDADIPDVDTPDADTPDADTPDADTPDADTPDADTPDADEPDVEMPGTCVELWAGGAPAGEDFDFGAQNEATTLSFELRLCEGAAPTRVNSLEVVGDAYTLALGSVSGWPAPIEEGRTLNFTLTFDPQEVDLDGELVVGVVDGPGEFRFGLTGERMDYSPECPVVTPQAAPSFTAVGPANPGEATGGLFDLSVAGTYVPARFSAQWYVVETPVGATSPVFYDRSDEAPTRVRLDAPGDYVIGLKLRDEQLGQDCAPEMLPVAVIESAFGDNDAVVTVTWSNAQVPNPSEGNGTDMDLHLCHPDGEFNTTDGWCVYWRSAATVWHTGNAELVIDDLYGVTGEMISQEFALPGFSYRVGVEYYSDNGYGPSLATAKLYQRGVEAHVQTRLLQYLDFWRPFDFDPATGVTVVDTVQAGSPLP
ncbi:hypothetical protein DL240_10525 [Lujinxingia litoralis]|uniref:Uncharacterized protein n=1 Tax=Lujinxingia litoralis TaxID=2211119 RepID=A0A328C6V1_9DELT|nr:hypothetical protein [Lujinxingia litoralis]RAL22278.1 hypothetical protein DL240_10525 [Lujinxingia litoralis]